MNAIIDMSDIFQTCLVFCSFPYLQVKIPKHTLPPIPIKKLRGIQIIIIAPSDGEVKFVNSPNIEVIPNDKTIKDVKVTTKERMKTNVLLINLF